MAESEASRGDVRGASGATTCAKRGQCRRGQRRAYGQKIGVLPSDSQLVNSMGMGNPQGSWVRAPVGMGAGW